MSDFYNQGAVPLTSRAYIPRQFEQSVFSEINAGRWVLLLGPRQHGKSSGLVRLNARLREAGYTSALVDLQALPPCSTFVDLLRGVANQIGRHLQHQAPTPRHDLQDQVSAWLDAIVPSGNTPVAVIIDEAGSIDNEQYRNSFYGQIRELSSLRANASPDAIASRIRFVFAGTFRPETLVQERNSPFNVCQLVYTDDITVGQATQLANDVNPVMIGFVQKAHQYLNGQPYLLQTIFQETLRKSELPVETAFAEALENLQHVAGSHLEGIFSKVIGHSGLVQKVSEMVQQGSVDLSPADSDCSFLQVLGLAKRLDRKLIFRNSLYEQVAKISPQLQPAKPAVVSTAKTQVFPIEKPALTFMTDPNLRELCFSAYDAAAKAHSNGNFRLALIGFGSALEAMLLDYLIARTAGELQAAINSGRFIFRPPHEVAGDPKTWRLVNLIDVTKKARTVSGTYPEPSHALRDWRNLVHPAVAMTNFVDESKLEPESVAASAMFCMLLRDVSP